MKLEFQKKPEKELKELLSAAGIPINNAVFVGNTVIIDCDSSKKAAIIAYMSATHDNIGEKP